LTRFAVRRSPEGQASEGHDRHHLHANDPEPYRHACLQPLGAVHSVVFGGFAPTNSPSGSMTQNPGHGHRVGRAEGKKLLEYKPLLDKASRRPSISREMHHLPRQIVKPPDRRPRPGLGKLMAGAKRWAAHPSRQRTLCTSSTPRAPRQTKGVVRDNGGHAVALR